MEMKKLILCFFAVFILVLVIGYNITSTPAVQEEQAVESEEVTEEVVEETTDDPAVEEETAEEVEAETVQ